MESGDTATSQGRLVVAGVAGNILEWYDFSVYGFSAPSAQSAQIVGLPYRPCFGASSHVEYKLSAAKT
jgi:hypothetical protein